MLWGYQRYRVKYLVIATLCSPLVCHGFAASNKGRFWDNLLGNIVGPWQSSEPTTRNGALLLKELNITRRAQPRTFYARPQQWPALLTASMPALFRFGSGVFADGYKVAIAPRNSSQYTVLSWGDSQLSESGRSGRRQQYDPIVIYEFEACPFCRKVREAASILSLTVTYRPCPQNGRLYRKDIKESYGIDSSFPFLRDPNTGVEMFESDDIVTYLFKMYGNGQVPWTLSSDNGPFVALTAGLGLLARFGEGSTSLPSNAPFDGEPLLLWAYEGSPFCKLVREELSGLEIHHTQISCPRGSRNRQALLDQTGRFQVPFLLDPNTGVRLFENEVILEYLRKQYGVETPPVKYI